MPHCEHGLQKFLNAMHRLLPATSPCAVKCMVSATYTGIPKVSPKTHISRDKTLCGQARAEPGAGTPPGGAGIRKRSSGLLELPGRVCVLGPDDFLIWMPVVLNFRPQRQVLGRDFQETGAALQKAAVCLGSPLTAER